MEVEEAVQQSRKERLAKACFFVKPVHSKVSTGKHKGGKHKTSQQEGNGDDFGGFTCISAEESQEHVQARFNAYNWHWREMEQELQTLATDLNEKMFSAVCSFATNCHFKKETLGGLSTTAYVEVPTALVAIGANIPDHEMFFGHLADELLTLVTPHIARLRSNGCNNLQTSIKQAFEQIMFAQVKDEDDQQRQEGKGLGKAKPNTKANIHLTAPDFSILQHWYNEQYPATIGGNGTTEILEANIRKPVIIMFEDFESFQPRLVEDFIALSANILHSGGIPIVFLFGLATTFETFHSKLSRSAISHLSTRRFAFHTATQTLEHVAEHLLLDSRYPLWLGARAYSLLNNRFRDHSVSLAGFEQTLQQMLLDHFKENACSFLCVQDVPTACKLLTNEHFEELRSMLSFRKYVESLHNNPRQQIALLEDNDAMRSAVETLLRSLFSYRQYLRPALSCLHTLTLLCPKLELLGHSMQSLHQACLEEDMVNYDDYNTIMTALKACHHDQLQMVLEKCEIALAGIGPLENKKIGSEISDESRGNICILKRERQAIVEMINRLKHLKLTRTGNEEDDDRDTDEDINDVDNNDSYAGHSNGSSIVTEDDNKYTGTTKQDKNSQDTSGRRGARTRMEMKKNPVIAQAVFGVTGDEEARKHGWSLHKKRRVELLRSAGLDAVWVKGTHARTRFETVRERAVQPSIHVKQQVSAAHRIVLQTAFARPGRYLSNSKIIDASSTNNMEDISPDLPDLCIIYRLLLECGRLVNLYDWLQAFSYIVAPNFDWEEAEQNHDLNALKGTKQKKKPEKESKKETEKYIKEKEQRKTQQQQLQVRFARAVGELQFLGFIRSTKRKTDHVERLTWG